MSKQVQIDWELFLDLYDFFFSDEAPEGYKADEIRKKSLKRSIKSSIESFSANTSVLPQGQNVKWLGKNTSITEEFQNHSERIRNTTSQSHQKNENNETG